MSEIATYKCSNQQCRLTLRLAGNFPVWDDARTNIIRYRSESFCLHCNKVVEYTSEHLCAACNNAIEPHHLGRPCPRCAAGIFSMPALTVF